MIHCAIIEILFHRHRHASGSSLVEALDAEEAQKLAECLDYILDIVGDTIPEIQSKPNLCKIDICPFV